MDETKTPRKYTISPAVLQARRDSARKAAEASVKARQGKAPGGVLSTEMIPLKVAPLTRDEIDKRKKPGEARHTFIHRAVMKMPLPKNTATGGKNYAP